MEKKNTVLLTVIAVATLLVAVVGATFAYFTATANTDGNGTATSVNTRAETGGVDLVLETKTTAVDGNISYPGGYVVNGAMVTATSKGTDNYKVDYTLNGSISNGTDTELKYTVYQVTVANALESTDKAVDGCTMSQYQDGTEIRYTYANLNEAKTALATPIASTCTVNAKITGGTAIGNGTVGAATVTTGEGGAQTVTPKTEPITISSTAKTSMQLTSTSAGASTYYYLVVEYPEKGTTQAATGANISATLSSVSNTSASQA